MKIGNNTILIFLLIILTIASIGLLLYSFVLQIRSQEQENRARKMKLELEEFRDTMNTLRLQKDSLHLELEKVKDTSR